jgi:Glycosyltransferase family 28 C-terminal domain/Monogalactosyldiacylglycerol (MGDG) synthase
VITTTAKSDGSEQHRKVTIIFHHAGGGHRNAADALREILTAQTPAWDVGFLNLQELLAPLDIVRRTTGLNIEGTYNLILRKGWTRFTPQLLVLLQTTIRAAHSPIVNLLRKYWREHPTDLVLSVIPHFNREIAASLIDGERKAPFVTLLTDVADYPPRFWIEPNSEFLIVGSERAKQQALAMGHSDDRIFQTSGMILKPGFYQELSIDRAAERKRHGLDPNRPTGIILFGGHGSSVMLDIAKKLQSVDVQLILVCGHNQKLAAKLRELKTRRPMLIEGFTTNVQYFMSLSDFFIGKPGPGSISEALQLHLPVIVECNSKTLPQERYNTQWVSENGYGIVVKNFRDIVPAVQKMLDEKNFRQFRKQAAMYSNRALFEIPPILEKCLSTVRQGQQELLTCKD